MIVIARVGAAERTVHGFHLAQVNRAVRRVLDFSEDVVAFRSCGWRGLEQELFHSDSQ